MEGMAREIVNKLNSIRRDLDFHVQDRIKVQMKATDFIMKAFETHRNYVEKETLIREISFEENEGEVWDLNGHEARINISKVK